MTTRFEGVGTIDDVLDRFERSTPPPGDEKRHFHGVYHRNTVAVKEDLEAGGFLDPEWLEPWDVIFANLYLDALDRWTGDEQPSGPWQVAFRAAEDHRISPLVHVLVGLNAHLNFDLPQALLAVINDEEFADVELIRRRHRDFAHIDEIVVRRVKDEDLKLREVEEPGDRTFVDQLMTPLNRAASKRFLQEARYKVWRNALELSLARRLGAEAYAARLRELEDLCRRKVEDLVRPGKVLVRLALTGYGVLLGPPTASGLGNPAGWPAKTLPVLDRFLSCGYATVTRAGHPVTYPVTPYVGEEGRTLEVSCGLTSPAKAERARRNPKVGLVYWVATGSGLDDPAIVTVRGKASVRDRDLQRNTDRYVRWSLAKLPAPWRRVPRWVMRGLDWYWSRIWVEVTPERIAWWPGGDLGKEPSTWTAPKGTAPAPSDPPPGGRQPEAWREPVPDHRERASRVAAEIGSPVLTVIDGDGYPAPLPTVACSWDGGVFHLRIAAGAPTDPLGPACLTFHRNSPDFHEYENAVFVGTAERDGEELVFRVERALPDISLSGPRWRRIVDFASSTPRVKRRGPTEAARRGQPPPRIRIPRYR